MRTIDAIDKIEKRKRIAKETMEIYAPLADRMGMHRIRDELEDLSFKVLNNEARELINKRLAETSFCQSYSPNNRDLVLPLAPLLVTLKLGNSPLFSKTPLLMDVLFI